MFLLCDASSKSRKKKKTDKLKKCDSIRYDRNLMTLMEKHITQRLVEYETRNNNVVKLLNEQIHFLKSELAIKSALVESLMRELDLKSKQDRVDPSVRAHIDSHNGSSDTLDTPQTSSGYNSISSVNESGSTARREKRPLCYEEEGSRMRRDDVDDGVGNKGRRKRKKKKVEKVRGSDVLCTYV
jgi:hypothetical protein